MDRSIKEKTVLFRLNASYHHQLSWQDAGFKKTIYIAPSLELRASDRLKINLNADFYNAEATSPSAVFSIASANLWRMGLMS